MAYSAFGKQFGDSFRQAWKSAEERDEKEKDRKARVAETIARENRAALRVAEARKQAALEALAGRAEGPLSEALVDQGISTEQKPLAPRLYEESLRPLTNMQAIRRDLPSGDTIEDIRKQQAILAAIKGSERRAAAEPEAMREADLRLRAEIAAQKGSEEEVAGLAERDFAKKFNQETTLREAASKNNRTREGRVSLSEMAGEDGEPFTYVIETIATEGEGGLGGELHNAWRKGQRTNLSLSHAGRVKRSLTRAIADTRAGNTPRNPWDAGTDESRIWKDTVDIALLEDPIEKEKAWKKSQADLLKMERDRKNAMEVAEGSPSYKQAQSEFDKWWDGVVSRIPTTGGAAPTLAQIAAEAQSRGIDPQLAMGIQSGALRGANRIGIPRFRDTNYTNFLKQNQGWFTTAKLVETKQGGKPVGYNTAFSALRAVEAMGDRDVAEQLKQDTATARSLIEQYNADLVAIRAVNPRPEVMKIAESIALEPDISAITQFKEGRRTSKLGWDEAMKLSGKPANTAFIVEQAPEVFTRAITTIDAAGNIERQDVELTHRIRRNPYRALTPNEVALANREEMQRNQFKQDPSSPKDPNDPTGFKLGQEIWIRVN